MSIVLYIKANAKPEDQSRTYKVSDQFIETYKSTHPNDNIITLDLYKEGIHFLTGNDLGIINVSEYGQNRDHPILKYAYQFAEADKYVIAEPMWNLSIPAILKAYIDYICITGITFKYTENGPVGMCHGKKAINIVARGGAYSDGGQEFEMGDRYLRTLFGFLGITDFRTIALEMLDVMGQDVEGIVKGAIQNAVEIAKNF